MDGKNADSGWILPRSYEPFLKDAASQGLEAHCLLGTHVFA